MMNEGGHRRPTRLRVHLWDPLARFMIQRGLAPGGDNEDGRGTIQELIRTQQVPA